MMNIINDTHSILIADDEQTFRDALADYLRDEGYRCDSVPDADTAIEKLQVHSYHLLISDIRMPGNQGLKLIHHVQKFASNMPVILVTGYPSFDTAAKAVRLPVIAYLTKPLDFEELRTHVATGVMHSQACRTVRSTQERVARWNEELIQLEAMLTASVDHSPSDSFTLFANISLNHAASTLAELGSVMDRLTQQHDTEELAEAVSGVNFGAAKNAIQETIRVLGSTKSSFKSKPLGKLRRKLQVFMDGLEDEDQ